MYNKTVVFHEADNLPDLQGRGSEFLRWNIATLDFLCVSIIKQRSKHTETGVVLVKQELQGLDYCLLDLLGGRRRLTQQLIPSSLCRSSPISGTFRE